MKSTFFLIWLILSPTLSLAGLPQDWSKPNSEKNTPHEFLFKLCKERGSTCVIDLTAKDICKLDGQIPQGATPVVLRAFTKMCPQYRWVEQKGIFVVESASGADSALNVAVGPVDGRLSIAEVMSKFIEASGLQLGDPAEGNRVVGRLVERKVAFIRKKFALKRTSFKDNMIEAAGQLRPSIWEVYRTGPNTFFFQVDSAVVHK